MILHVAAAASLDDFPGDYVFHMFSVICACAFVHINDSTCSKP